MPKTHPEAAAKILYRIKSPDVWRAIRAEWEAGGRPAALARRFDVSDSSISARRTREGWTREAGVNGLLASKAADASALAIAEAALGHALLALNQGRAPEALALIKAGDAVGAFADFVRRLREGRDARPRDDVADAPPAAEVASLRPEAS